MYAIGIDIGGTKTAYGLFDENGCVVEHFRRPSDPCLSAGAFFDGVVEDVRGIMRRHGLADADLSGIGIGLPSFVIFDEGYIVKTSTLTNLKNFPARAYFREKLGGGIRIVLDNDAHAAALAESRYGAGRGFRHMLYCPVSTGISSAIIINGELFRGSYGFAGESGHMIVTPGEGVLCGCENRGCFMSYSSGAMIVRHVRSEIAKGRRTIMDQMAGGDPCSIRAEHIARAYDLGDDLAIWVIDQMSRYMGQWLFNLYVTLNINCFVFGGGLLEFGDRLFPRVRAQFDLYNNSNLPIYFKHAELEDRVGIVGAAELLKETLNAPKEE